MVAQKKQRPLIRYAGSAAETSIGSKPIGSELKAGLYPKLNVCQASFTLALSLAYLPDLRQTGASGGEPHTVTHCPDMLFSLARARPMSQSCRVEAHVGDSTAHPRASLRIALQEHHRDPACLR